MLEDLKQNLNEMTGKLEQRNSIVEQLNNDITKLKQKLEQSDIRVQQYQVRSGDRRAFRVPPLDFH